MNRPLLLRLHLAFFCCSVVLGCGPKADHAPPTSSIGDQAVRQPAEGPHRSVQENPATNIRLLDVTDASGIQFRHEDGSTGLRYIIETMSAGLALFDYDGDGFVDIYFVSGAAIPSTIDTEAAVERTPKNALYRNLGDGRFVDVTLPAGVGDAGFGLGVTAGDYDNDGHVDLFVNNAGADALYHNNGDGTFSDATDNARVAGGERIGAGACFLDIEGDGDLDLFVANYVQISYPDHRPKYVGKVPAYPDPLDHPPENDRLYSNDGDGRFSDISEISGVAARAATGMGMIACDYDNDGDTDIFVANDVMANWLFQNDGRGAFKDVAISGGIAFDSAGMPQSNMGVDAGDYDNDGRLDFHVTSYQNELPVLYRNLGAGFYHDVTRTVDAGQGAFHHVTWGNGFVDFDNDGDRDLFIACGHTEDNIELRDDKTSYKARNIVLMNGRSGRFVDVSASCGDGLAVVEASRGVGLDDLDNDGRVDVAILNHRQVPTILSNETPRQGHWLQVRLVGTRSNRDGVGAHVRVMSGDSTQLDEVHSGRGYQSHFGSRLHFGLGSRNRADRIEVRWIGGGTDVIEDVAVDRCLTILEGVSGQAPRE